MERFPRFEKGSDESEEMSQDLAIVDQEIFIKPTKKTPVKTSKKKPTLDDFDPPVKEMKNKVVRRQYNRKLPKKEKLEVSKNPEEDFEKFINYMDKYEKIKQQRAEEQQQKEREQKERLEREEKEREAAYFKKFQEASEKKRLAHQKVKKQVEQEAKNRVIITSPQPQKVEKNPYEDLFNW